MHAEDGGDEGAGGQDLTAVGRPSNYSLEKYSLAA